MKITPEIRKAILDYIGASKGRSATSLSRELKLANSTVARWISIDGAKEIRSQHWAKLYPILLPYLPKDKVMDESLKEYNKALKKGFINSQEQTPVRTVGDMELDSVPVIGFASAASYEPALEPWDDFIIGYGDTTALFSDVKPGYFALRVDGDSMSPSFPDGTLLLVGGGEFPERGDLVAAKLTDQDGIVVVKRYMRRNGLISLEAENSEGRSFEVKVKEEPGRIVWMYPVIKAEIDLRKRRRRHRI